MEALIPNISGNRSITDDQTARDLRALLTMNDKIVLKRETYISEMKETARGDDIGTLLLTLNILFVPRQNVGGTIFPSTENRPRINLC